MSNQGEGKGEEKIEGSGLAKTKNLGRSCIYEDSLVCNLIYNMYILKKDF